MADVKHTLGLLLGTEEDWPRAFEQFVAHDRGLLAAWADDASR